MSTTTSTPDPTPGTPDSEAMIGLLDIADALPGAAALRQRSYDLLALSAGSAVVDVGCGTGRAVAELAERGMRPVGVDVDEQIIDLARQRWPGTDLRIGDAYHLPFPDASFTGYRADKVFHGLADPGRALAEAHRVLVPGGRIVLIGQDWDSFIIDADDIALTRTILHARADTIPSPWAGRRYRNLLRAAGFQDATVEVQTAVFTDATMLTVLLGVARAAQGAGAITATQADGWIAEQTDRADNGTLFLAIPLFVAAAHRPYLAVTGP
ncbi:methyltransferase domain-containing protein [Virgisporangium aurantiacum]|uniref:Methyltransferase n=1 Tax=Virgisporangium aurantiacum TaxID=175570 RepID=A0A8J3ZKY6_9ACTN|nr:methyltransferase domain-containing protein [Virgisporangium aurantiacum]GIJ63350.1 methyltransferase [Virgisporangium aurantiacum]